MRVLRVLSVDWDYFIEATMEQRWLMFPDGGNEKLPPALSDTIWAARYAEHDELTKINLDKSGYNTLKKIIKKLCNSQTKVFIADSHLRIYDFIKDNYKDDLLYINNIDFHHDYYYSQDGVMELNCGNWVNAIIDKDNVYNDWVNPVNVSYSWVCREDSDLSGRLEKNPQFGGYFMIEDLLKDTEDQEPYDLLFICRSSMWSPPHLDKYFFDLIKTDVVKLGADIELGFLTEDRYTDGMCKQVKEYRDFLDTAIKDLEKRRAEHDD